MQVSEPVMLSTWSASNYCQGPTVGAPVGSNMFRSGWYLEYIESQVQPLLDAISELALHDNDLGAQSAFIILK